MRTLKYIGLAFCLLFLALAVKAQTPGTTFYGVQSTPVCWTTAGGVDSTIYQVSLSPAGSTKPTQMFFYTPIVGTAKVQAVTVTGGTIAPGPCFEQQQLLDNDTVINNLDIIINLLGGSGDTCQVVNKSNVALLTTTTTYSANTRNSIAILPLSGTITLQVDGGTAASLTNGNTVVYNGRPCRYLDSSFTINITSGSALVTWIY